jgi:hypothetical protein
MFACTDAQIASQSEPIFASIITPDGNTIRIGDLRTDHDIRWVKHELEVRSGVATRAQMLFLVGDQRDKEDPQLMDHELLQHVITYTAEHSSADLVGLDQNNTGSMAHETERMAAECETAKSGGEIEADKSKNEAARAVEFTLLVKSIYTVPFDGAILECEDVDRVPAGWTLRNDHHRPVGTFSVVDTSEQSLTCQKSLCLTMKREGHRWVSLAAPVPTESRRPTAVTMQLKTSKLAANCW